MEKSFEEWYDAFLEFVRHLGWGGFVDRESFKSDYESGVEPMAAAKEFIKELSES